MTCAYFGSLQTKPGYRDEVIAILLSFDESLRAAGCSLFAVGVSDSDPDTIFGSEIWESREHHDRWRDSPKVQNAMSKAMPMLTGEATAKDMTIVGGVGV